MTGIDIQESNFVGNLFANLEVPDHVRHFDEQKSFLNITEDEVLRLFSTGKPYFRSTVLNRLRLLISLDYRNFLESVGGMQFAHILRHSIESDDIDSIDRVSLVPQSLMTLVKTSINEAKQLRPSYRYVHTEMPIGGIRSHLYFRLCGNLRKLWLDGKYAYLDPFFLIGNSYVKVGCLTLEDDDFVANVIKWLYVNGEKDRRELYATMHVLSAVHDMFTSDKYSVIYKIMSRLASSRHKKHIPSSENPANTMQFTTAVIDWDEEEAAERLATLRGNDTRSEEEKQAFIYSINEKYHQIRPTDDSVKDELKMMDTFAQMKYTIPLVQNLAQEQIVNVYIYYKQRKLQTITYSGTVDVTTIKAPDCYIGYLLDYDDVNEKIEITIDNTIIEDILYLLLLNKNKGLLRLLKTIYILNYLKSMMGNISAISPERAALLRVVETAVTYVRVIFTDTFRSDKVSELRLKEIFKEILMSKVFSSELFRSVPKGFDGNFNLILTYSVIGFLNSQAYFKPRKVSAMDKAIIKDNGVKKATEWRKYIEQWQAKIDKDLKKALIAQYA